MVVVFDQPFQILLELVRSNKLDPWDIDIDRLTKVFIQRIHEMQELDLRVSGRTLLSAAILLRMKSRKMAGMKIDEEEQQLLDEDLDLDLPDLGDITMMQLTPRKITLDELIGSLQEALAEPPPKKSKAKRRPKPFIPELNGFYVNIEEKLLEFHKHIAGFVPNGEIIGITDLLKEYTRIEFVRNLLMALFLCKDGKIDMWQEEPLGEIFLRLEEKPGA